MKAPTNFWLSIECGNDAMRTYEDIAEALRKVADRIENGTREGRIRDTNGNSVGGFEVVEEEE